MSMNWFIGIETVDGLRQRYKELLKKHHPDNGGDVHTMQKINAEYDILLVKLQVGSDADRQSGVNQEEEKAFKEILNSIITFNITIEIIGNWIWCFDCYAYKDRLKTLGFKYAPKKCAWTWHYGKYSRYHKREVSIDDIRAKYGSKRVYRTNSTQYHLKNQM